MGKTAAKGKTRPAARGTAQQWAARGADEPAHPPETRVRVKNVDAPGQRPHDAGEKRHGIRVLSPSATIFASGCSEVDISQSFDLLNRITAINHAHLQKTQRNEWDAAGNRTAMWVDGIPNSRADYSWDSRNRLAAIAHQAMGNVAYAYNAAGQKTTLTYPNGIVCSYTYDTNGRLTLLDYRRPDQSQVFFENLTYDPRGNITQRVDDEGTHDYQYDALDQLTRAAYPDGTWEEFAYDKSGNRSSLTTAGGVAAYQVDDADQLLSVSGPGQSELTTFGWTPNGEMGSQLASGQTTSTTYGWDTRSMLVRVSRPAGPVETFAYLPQEWRGWIYRSTGLAGVTTYQLWDADTGNPLAELSGGFAPLVLRGYAAGLDYPLTEFEVSQGTARALVTDHVGSTQRVLSLDASLLGSQRFAVFGPTQGQPLPENASRIGYAGRTRVGSSSLTDLGNRIYLPSLGRFASFDPIGTAEGLNRFRYGANSPLLFRDPLGLRIAWSEVRTFLEKTDIGLASLALYDNVEPGDITIWPAASLSVRGGATCFDACKREVYVWINYDAYDIMAANQFVHETYHIAYGQMRSANGELYQAPGDAKLEEVGANVWGLMHYQEANLKGVSKKKDYRYEPFLQALGIGGLAGIVIEDRVNEEEIARAYNYIARQNRDFDSYPWGRPSDPTSPRFKPTKPPKNLDPDTCKLR